ncbi:hypothetical protein D1872_301360 [compost metagenome]
MRPFCMTPSSNTPRNVPHAEPLPPRMFAPPMTTAEITVISNPSIPLGSTDFVYIVCAIAATPAIKPT